MFSLMHKFFHSFLTKPSIHYIKPKALNLFFKDSYRPEYMLLNLEKYNYIKIIPSVEKEIKVNNEEAQWFSIKLELSSNEKTELVKVATFTDKEDMEKAVIHLKNKLYSPEKVAIKVVVTSFVIVFLTSFLLALFQANFGNSKDDLNTQLYQQLQQQYQQNSGMNPYQMPPTMQGTPAIPVMPNMAGNNNVDPLAAARKQAEEIMRLGMQNRGAAVPGLPGAPTVPSPPPSGNTTGNSAIEIPQDPAISNFMKGLN